ncbi:MAG: hypothetical protein ACI9JK_001296 [Phycisphaerales bacterium]|jgi:hypothetical protein
MRNLITCLSVCVLSAATFADTWTVDDDGKADFDNIQAAFTAAGEGDDILVMPGTYTGTGESVVQMNSKSVWLHSSNGPDVTFIDGQGKRRCITNHSTSQSVNLTIQGFTFQNGNTTSNGGGGALYFVGQNIPDRQLNVVDCIFRSNSASTSQLSDDGGAIALNSWGVLIQDSFFIDNFCDRYGSAIYLNHPHSSQISRCVFIDNTSAGDCGYAVTWYSAGNLSVDNTFACGSLPSAFGSCFGNNYIDNGGNEFTLNCEDCNSNGITDINEIIEDATLDCNMNFIIDECELDEITDCNSNGNLDSCDLEEGLSQDVNGSGIPDECECLSDIALNDNQINIHDLLNLIALYGTNSEIADINYDGNVNIHDLLLLIGAWGVCP